MSEQYHSGVSPSVEPSPVILDHCALGANGVARQRGDDCAKRASPRSVTTGGNSFPSETPETPLSSLAFIDYFAFTIKPPEGSGLRWMFDALHDLFQISEMTPTGKGWNGYKDRFDLGGYGLLAHGGESQRGSIHVELTGTGCARVPYWQKVMEWGEAHNITVTRLDLAHDDIEGKTVSIAAAREWLKTGLFSFNGMRVGKTAIKAKLIDDLGSGEGKTLYVGARGSGKLCRVYEKGRQLGDTASPWTRVEVEWRNKGRAIPLDALVNPGHYLAGAYPCLSFLSVVQEKIRTITKSVTITLNSAIHHAKQMAGKLVNVMMQFHGGDAFAVVNELKRDGIPKRLENYADFLPQVFAGGAP